MFDDTVPSWMNEQLKEHSDVAHALRDQAPHIADVAERLCRAFAAGGTAWAFGNGGSAADAQHFTGEIIGHYKRDRRPLPMVTLSTDPSTMTCIANDYSYEDCFARQVQALARPSDVVFGFTTSGMSPNVVSALRAARSNGAVTVLFGGRGGGDAAQHADHVLMAPSDTTARIQEMHTLMLHLISEYVDQWASRKVGDA